MHGSSHYNSRAKEYCESMQKFFKRQAQARKDRPTKEEFGIEDIDDTNLGGVNPITGSWAPIRNNEIYLDDPEKLRSKEESEMGFIRTLGLSFQGIGKIYKLGKIMKYEDAVSAYDKMLYERETQSVIAQEIIRIERTEDAREAAIERVKYERQQKIQETREKFEKELNSLKTDWDKSVFKKLGDSNHIIRLEDNSLRLTGVGLLSNIEWQDFEKVMIYVLKEQGWDAKSTSSGADGGLDAVGIKGKEKLLLQAKHWKANVGRPALDSLMGLSLREKPTHVVLASSSGFTQEVREIFRVLYHSDANVNEGINLPYKLELWGNSEIAEFIDSLPIETYQEMIDPMRENILNRLRLK